MAQLPERERCAHLLRRFGLGASEPELDEGVPGGAAALAGRLLRYGEIDEGFDLEIGQLALGQNQRVNMAGVVAWWALRLIMTRRPLQERMTLFWHNHFATSAGKVQAPGLMYGQNETLRRHATGKFGDLLRAVAKDPAMLFWLDAQENVAGKPQENFARELMELFTLGIGHYSEQDVQEAARAFTGWAFVRGRGADFGKDRPAAQFLFRQARHDRAEKSVLGVTGPLDGDAVLELLLRHPRTAEFVTEKIWSHFVYPSPSAETLKPFVKVFADSGLDIGVLLLEIMRSSEFYSERARRAVVKSPVDFCVGTLRQLGYGDRLRQALGAAETPTRAILAPGFVAAQAMRSMGMWLLHPEDVDGWKGGEAWITSATMIERIKWADRLFGGASGRAPGLRFPAATLLAGSATPAQTVRRILTVFDVPIPQSKLPELVEAARAASGGRVGPRNAAATAAAVSRLIFASPEFQMA
jgi:uncharacterized protein (DUF1800 family)